MRSTIRRIGTCGVIVCALTLALAQQPASRVVIYLPQGQTFWPDLSISPDGTQVAYIASTGGILQLYVRRLNELKSRTIPGTAGTYHGDFFPMGSGSSSAERTDC